MTQTNELLEALKAIVKSLADQDDEGLIEHAEQMIAARAAIQRAESAVGEPVKPLAWIRPSGRAMLEAGGYCTVYASEGMSNHSVPLYDIPQAIEASEPVATFHADIDGDYVELIPYHGQPLVDGQPLYATPPAAVPLSDKAIMRIYEDCDEGGDTLEFTLGFARAIEQAHGIGEKK